MDANLNKIFNSDKDWIVTTNQNGKTKISAKNESELHEETKNFIEFEDKKPKTRQNYVYMKTKVVRLFICDVHRAMRQDDFFTFKNISFITLELFGTVTSAYVHGDYNCIILDDGMSNIICLFKKEFADGHKINCNSKLNELYSVLNENDSTVLKAALMVKKNTRDVLNKVPRFCDINVGDNVKIIGKLSEYNNKKYVFINRFQVNTDSTTDNIKDLIDLYKNYKL